MRPSESLRRTARDRARRVPPGRLDQPQIQLVRTWPDAKPAPVPDDSVPAPKSDRAQPYVVATILALALTLGGVIGLAGSGTLQEALRAIGVLGETALETAQRKQAGAISELDAAVNALNAAVAGLSAHADFAGTREEAQTRRMERVDDELGALKSSLGAVRTAQEAAAAEEPWRKPMAQLTAVVAKARSDITGLRASLDDLGQARPAGLAAVGERIDRLERAMVQNSLLGPIRGSIQDSAARRRPATLSESAPVDITNGHIINLTPVAQ